MQQIPLKNIHKEIQEHWVGPYSKCIQHQGNWPVDAEYGAVINFVDRDFPGIKTDSISFFSNREEIDKYIQSKTKEYTGTSFSLTILLYEWDLGPKFLNQLTIN